jgi:hypothetical protein
MKFSQEIQPGIRIFQKLTLMKSRKKPTGELFFLYDSGNDNNNRIIMFGTARNIALLNEFLHWCVDGTFKVAPQFFTQVYTYVLFTH